MKQSTTIRLLGGLCMAIIMLATMSCGRTHQEEQGELLMDTITESGEVSIGEGVDTPSIAITISYVYPKGNDRLIRSFNTIFFGDSLYATLSPENATKRYIERRGAQYRDEYAGTKTDGLNSDLFNKNIDISDSILYADSALIALQVRTYTEDGLTPPTTDIRYYNLMRTTGSILVEGDLFVEDYKEPITRLIVEQLVQTFGVQTPNELESQGFFNLEDLQPNGNFYLDNKGITYRFDRIDMVASESDTKLVTLSYDLISSYIKPDSPIKAYLH